VTDVPRGVPLEPVARHVRQLMSRSGAGPHQVARAAGVSERTIRYLLSAPPGRRIYRPTARRLMMVRQLDISSTGSIPAHGVLRRVEALACLGWSRAEIARRVGLSSATLRTSNLAACAPSTVIKVALGYESLRGKLPIGEPVVERTRLRAQLSGFAPPWAWLGRQIDDPKAMPSFSEIDNKAWAEACRLRYASRVASSRV
jgi:transcriptional regulator with XRE-family HTH domain